MKDRNGVELQVGDVCVVYQLKKPVLAYEALSSGCLVEVTSTEPTKYGRYTFFECNGAINMNGNELEIIGDVR